MTTTEMIRTLKARVKEFALLQKKGKRARKTLIPDRAALLRELGIEAEEAPRQVWRRKALITAALNLSLELRGRPYRHGIREGLEYACEAESSRLRSELAAV
jgi:hypothetical protein